VTEDPHRLARRFAGSDGRAGRRFVQSDARVWRRFLIAAAISGAVHAATIVFGRLELPPAPNDLPPLAVRVVRLEQDLATAPRVTRVAPAKPRVAGIPVRQEPRAAPLPGPAAGTDEVDAAPAEATADVPPPPQPEPIVVATAPPSTFIPDTAAVRSFPRRGRLSFNILYGPDGFPVGRTEQSWQIDGTRYQLSSRSETTGLVDVFRSQHRTYTSRGELTESGLRPESFQMSRDRGRGLEEASAQFDWTRATVSLGRPGAQREQALPRGSQDLVSFMYQLALDPPPQGRTRVSVTNGTRLESYDLDVHPEEKIETPLGIMRALPIRQVRTTRAETIDFWLATEYRHLPVRIRFYGRDGEPTGEQIVTEIRLTEE
jgi:hypothetical protein